VKHTENSTTHIKRLNLDTKTKQ